MLVELGNPSPVVCAGAGPGHAHDSLGLDAPAVTYVNIPDGLHPDGSPLYGFDPGVDINALARHLLSRPDGVSHLPGHEALLIFAHQAGMPGHHFTAPPTWARCSDPGFGELLGRWFDCPAVGPDFDVEDTHYTLAGAPGVRPPTFPDLQANITQNGRDIWAQGLGGGQVGSTGQATASGATSLTNTGAAWTTNQWAGYTVYASVSATQMVFGQIISNTGTVLTVDRWYTVATPGGAAGSTPSATATYVIIQGVSPAWFMGLTANSSAPASPSTATSLTGEITTASGGLVRKICPYAHSASANTYTLTPVFTANGFDSLPVTVAKIGVFNSMVVSDSTQTMLFETLLSATATLTSSGDHGGLAARLPVGDRVGPVRARPRSRARRHCQYQAAAGGVRGAGQRPPSHGRPTVGQVQAAHRRGAARGVGGGGPLPRDESGRHTARVEGVDVTVSFFQTSTTTSIPSSASQAWLCANAPPGATTVASNTIAAGGSETLAFTVQDYILDPAPTWGTDFTLILDVNATGADITYGSSTVTVRRLAGTGGGIGSPVATLSGSWSYSSNSGTGIKTATASGGSWSATGNPTDISAFEFVFSNGAMMTAESVTLNVGGSSDTVTGPWPARGDIKAVMAAAVSRAAVY